MPILSINQTPGGICRNILFIKSQLLIMILKIAIIERANTTRMAITGPKESASMSNMLISIDTPLLPTAATEALAKSLESNLIAESDSPFVNLRGALRNRVLKQSMRRSAILKSGYSTHSI